MNGIYREPAEIPPEPPPSVPGFVLAARRRRRLGIAVLVASVPAIALAFWAVTSARSAVRSAALRPPMERAYRCLLGSDPLANDETAELRFRSRQHHALTTPSSDPLEAVWPAWCAPLLRAVPAVAGKGFDAQPFVELAADLEKPFPLVRDFSSEVHAVATILETELPAAR